MARFNASYPDVINIIGNDILYQFSYIRKRGKIDGFLVHTLASFPMTHISIYFQLAISTGHCEYRRDGLFMTGNLISAKWNRLEIFAKNFSFPSKDNLSL